MAARSRLQIQQTGIPDIIEIVSGFIHTRSALAIAGDRTINEPWIDRTHVVVSKAKPGHHARPKLFDENVRALDQRNEPGAVCPDLEIERHAGFASVEHQEGCALPVYHWWEQSRVFAAGLLDL